mmetsp:Transcript_63926/g.75680  ORF Transcript_63926/g.75680 Transcript_63926/m.75680 type:complete len:138 (+) Transcript_63926:600-1013(+)
MLLEAGSSSSSLFSFLWRLSRVRCSTVFMYRRWYKQSNVVTSVNRVSDDMMAKMVLLIDTLSMYDDDMALFGACGAIFDAVSLKSLLVLFLPMLLVLMFWTDGIALVNDGSKVAVLITDANDDILLFVLIESILAGY